LRAGRGLRGNELVVAGLCQTEGLPRKPG
jgi:hypothetical protein